MCQRHCALARRSSRRPNRSVKFLTARSWLTHHLAVAQWCVSPYQPRVARRFLPISPIISVDGLVCFSISLAPSFSFKFTNQGSNRSNLPIIKEDKKCVFPLVLPSGWVLKRR